MSSYETFLARAESAIDRANEVAAACRDLREAVRRLPPITYGEASAPGPLSTYESVQESGPSPPLTAQISPSSTQTRYPATQEAGTCFRDSAQPVAHLQSPGGPDAGLQHQNSPNGMVQTTGGSHHYNPGAPAQGPMPPLEMAGGVVPTADPFIQRRTEGWTPVCGATPASPLQGRPQSSTPPMGATLGRQHPMLPATAMPTSRIYGRGARPHTMDTHIRGSSPIAALAGGSLPRVRPREGSDGACHSVPAHLGNLPPMSHAPVHLQGPLAQREPLALEPRPPRTGMVPAPGGTQFSPQCPELPADYDGRHSCAALSRGAPYYGPQRYTGPAHGPPHVPPSHSGPNHQQPCDLWQNGPGHSGPLCPGASSLEHQSFPGGVGGAATQNGVATTGPQAVGAGAVRFAMVPLPGLPFPARPPELATARSPVGGRDAALAAWHLGVGHQGVFRDAPGVAHQGVYREGDNGELVQVLPRAEPPVQRSDPAGGGNPSVPPGPLPLPTRPAVSYHEDASATAGRAITGRADSLRAAALEVEACREALEQVRAEQALGMNQMGDLRRNVVGLRIQQLNSLRALLAEEAAATCSISPHNPQLEELVLLMLDALTDCVRETEGELDELGTARPLDVSYLTSEPVRSRDERSAHFSRLCRDLVAVLRRTRQETLLNIDLQEIAERLDRELESLGVREGAADWQLEALGSTLVPEGSPLLAEICPICRDAFVVGDAMMAVQCGHWHHEKCLVQWLRRKPECPLCKTALPISKDELDVDEPASLQEPAL